MARRSHMQPTPYPEPLPEAPVDPRLPGCLREIERDTFAKNRGYDDYDQYQSSRWNTPPPAKHDGPTKETGHVETAHVPGQIVTPKG